MVALVLNFFSV